jgi:uncharacterized protein involved in exopolysaccharide biosynthesis
MYNRLGRAAVRFAISYLWRRHKRRVWIGLGVATVVAAAAVGYTATRDVPEG